MEKYLERNGVEIKNKSVILYKRVSSELKTQEGTRNETNWTIGSTLKHHAWDPTKEECGEGKFHACCKTYFCDEFRSNSGDRYIAISVKVLDLYEWENPRYPYKIAFRECKVLYECNSIGNKIIR